MTCQVKVWRIGPKEWGWAVKEVGALRSLAWGKATSRVKARAAATAYADAEAAQRKASWRFYRPKVG